MTWEPRFDIDYEYGRQAELAVLGLFEGLKKGDLRAEVKRKRRPDSKFYVELEHDPGDKGVYVPSALSLTEAEVWVYTIADTDVHVLFPTNRLRTAIQLDLGHPAEQPWGSCPTRGRLVSFLDILRLDQGRER